MAQTHRCGWVALLGPPNAGKSTLTNALVGRKVAIVTDKPQTTRNRITGILTEPGLQAIFMDTPGIHIVRGQTRGQLGKLMLQSAWQSLTMAHAIMLILDGDLYVRKPEALQRDLESLLKPLQNEDRPVIVVVNKVDLFHDKSRMLPLLEELAATLPRAEIFPVSAAQRDGLKDLKTLVASFLPEAPAEFPEDQLSTAPLRFLSAEIVREQLFQRLYQEVPYSVAVEIERWEEDTEQNRVFINAVIYVARPTHKAMVIGRGGAGIKAIGTDARKQICELLDQKVHLELWVKVREDWVDDARFLHELGFGAENME